MTMKLSLLLSATTWGCKPYLLINSNFSRGGHVLNDSDGGKGVYDTTTIIDNSGIRSAELGEDVG